MCDFKMIEGDLVEVKLESGIVNFFNITKKLKESLQLSDNKSEMDQICFCANRLNLGSYYLLLNLNDTIIVLQL